MKKSIKILCMLLSVLFCFPLAACGEADELAKYDKLLKDNKKAINLTVWTYFNNNQRVAFENTVNEFNQTVGADLKIFVTNKSFDGDGVVNLAKALYSSASHEVGAPPMPNMFQSYSDDLLNLDTQFNVAASIDKYFRTSELDGYVSGFLEEGRFSADGSLKLIPYAKSTETFMLNKTDWDKFAKDRTDVSLDMLKTIEGITKVSEIYHNETGKAFFGRDAMANYIYLTAKSLGKELFVSDANGKVSLNLDKAVMQKIYDNYYVPYVQGAFLAKGKFRSDDVTTGKILAYVGSTASASYFPSIVKVNDSGTENYAIEAYVNETPMIVGSVPLSYQQGAGFAVSKSDTLTEYASAVFLKFISTGERNISNAVSLGYLPVTNEGIDYQKIEDTFVSLKLESMEDIDSEQDKQAAIQEILKDTKNRKILDVYRVTVKSVKERDMWAPKPFIGSADIRKILDHCIQGDMSSIASALSSDAVKLVNANELSALVDQDVADGKDRKQAISDRLNGNFEKWYQSLTLILEAKLGAAV